MNDDVETPEAPLRLTALSTSDAALLLSRSCHRPISGTQLDELVRSGAPANPDGTLNFIHLAAWLVRHRPHVP